MHHQDYPASHLKVLLAELYESSDDFSDVTILCDGNAKIKVNKVIFALHCSLFSELFSRDDYEEVIIMPEVNHKDIVAIFDLMFTGKSAIEIERLRSILSLGDDFQIKYFEKDMFKVQKFESNYQCRKEQSNVECINEPVEFIQEGFKFPKGDYAMKNIRNPIPVDDIGAVSFIKRQNAIDCSLCGKEFKTRSGVNSHHKKDHLKRRFVCNTCEAEFKTKQHLQVHFRVHHEGIKFECTQCKSTHTTKSSLKQHIVNIHGERKWKCHLCSNEYAHKGALKLHIESKHFGKRFQCLQCHKSMTDASNLKKHIQAVHDVEIRFPCSICNKTFTSKRNRHRHFKTCNKTAKEGL